MKVQAYFKKRNFVVKRERERERGRDKSRKKGYLSQTYLQP